MTNNIYERSITQPHECLYCGGRFSFPHAHYINEQGVDLGPVGYKEMRDIATDNTEANLIRSIPDLPISTAKSDQAEQSYEEVVHPKHYGGDEPYEVLKVLFAWGWGIPFCMGNATKYMRRNGEKPDAEGITDMEKATYYLQRVVDEMKRLKDGRPL